MVIIVVSYNFVLSLAFDGGDLCISDLINYHFCGTSQLMSLEVPQHKFFNNIYYYQL